MMITKAPYMRNILFKHKILPAVFMVLSIFGCSPVNIILDTEQGTIKRQDPSPILPYHKRITVFLEPITGMDESLWFKLVNYSWQLGKSPSILVKDAFEREFPFWGIAISEDIKKADARMKIAIRWFGPYGNSPNSAAVILAVTLYKGNLPVPIWHGKVEGGVLPRPFPMGAYNIKETIEQAIQEALSEALSKLRWNGEFCQAIKTITKIYND